MEGHRVAMHEALELLRLYATAGAAGCADASRAGEAREADESNEGDEGDEADTPEADGSGSDREADAAFEANTRWCSACAGEIFPDEQDAPVARGDALYCSTCWYENICHRCLHYEREPSYYTCDRCNRRV